mgnify:CR=1 FL=1
MTNINDSFAFVWAITNEHGGRKRRAKAGEAEKAPFAKFQTVTVWNDLPDVSKAFLIEYGLTQYLNDGGAGAETDAEFEAGIKSRQDKLLVGDFSRTKGEREAKADTLAKRILKVAKAAWAARIAGLTETQAAAFKALAKEAQDKAREAWLAKNAEAHKAEAERQLAAEAATADDDDLMAALGLTDDDEA